MKKILCSLFIILLCFVGTSYARVYNVTFEWTPNTESDLAGYKLYQSSESQQYTGPIKSDISSDVSTFTMQLNLVNTTYFVLTAFDVDGNESDFSNEVFYSPDLSPPNAPQGFGIKSIGVVIEFN